MIMPTLTIEPAAPGLLQGHTALVTGCSGVIGKAILLGFRAAGAKVLGTDLHLGDGAPACDLRDEASVCDLFDTLPMLTDIVHAVGTVSIGSVAGTSLAEFRRTLEDNLTTAFLVARAGTQAVRTGGSITVVASQAGLRGGALWGAYCASKFGVVGLVQCLAQELAPRQVRVNAVCPGWIDSPMSDMAFQRLSALTGAKPATLRAQAEANVPLGRPGSPAEVAGACMLLASSLAGYVTGASIVVDGGELT